MRLRLFALLILATWLSTGLGTGSALAEKRVALVMGNSAYKNVARLANPANDAALVGGMNCQRIWGREGPENPALLLELKAPSR